MRRVVIMGAGGRDFHDFATVLRDDPGVEVVAFTAAQIPGIDDRSYPAELAGARYPAGIPIRPEAELAELIATHDVDEVVLAYSDLSHLDVMHKASLVLAAGADFRLIGPRASMLHSVRPVIAVGATRTGCGKSPVSRRIGAILVAAGRRVALIRHPMPYGNLNEMAVQRFTSLDDIDRSRPTIEEREEYEAPVLAGMTVYAGVDYAAILALAEREADVIVWDGGNNDFPFVRPDLFVCVTDALRAGDELTYHPGETNLRLADVVVVNKVDSAAPADVARVVENVRAVNASARLVLATSPVTLQAGPEIAGLRVLVVEDGPTVTHGGMAFGAGTVAARQAGAATIVDPRPYAVGSIAETFARYPGIGAVLPAMGYSDRQVADLEATIAATPCDVVVTGTPIDLSRLLRAGHPIRHATYEVREQEGPSLAEIVAPFAGPGVRGPSVDGTA